MGYQKGVATLSSGGAEVGVILNCSTFVKESDLAGMTSTDFIIAEAYSALQKTTLAVTNIYLIPRPPETLKGVRRASISMFNASVATLSASESVIAARSSRAAEHAPITAMIYAELFRRFSAYENDNKVSATRGLLKGTFATTAEDSKHVTTGKEAIARYALKNKQSANKRFSINPPVSTRLQRGIVEPAHGEAGGGVEVIFVDGTPDYTVTGPEIIAE